MALGGAVFADRAVAGIAGDLRGLWLMGETDHATLGDWLAASRASVSEIMRRSACLSTFPTRVTGNSAIASTRSAHLNFASPRRCKNSAAPTSHGPVSP